MTRWIDLYNVHAEYVSDVVVATSDFDYYVERINYNYTDNEGIVSIDMRVSHDGGINWSDWQNINNSAYSPMFDGRQFPLVQTQFQYRVIFNVSAVGLISPVFDNFGIDLIGTFKIINTGDIVCKPELWVKKTGSSGDIKLTNETNGQTLELKNLNVDETVYIDCENEDIMTDLPMKYRYNDHNDVYLELEVGENHISGEGGFELDMRFQFKTLQG